MALVEHWRVDFDTDAKTNKFFYSPAPGGLANIADVRRVGYDGTSCIEIWIGDETPTVEYFSTPGGTDAYAKMVADVANQPDGAVAYCYSRTSSQHGRYVKAAGSWGTHAGSVTPKMADDENHRRVVQVQLLLQAYSAAGDPVAVGGKMGLPDMAVLNASIGRPATRDLSGWVMRWTMRAVGMSMGRRTKIFQHYQTRTAGPRVGSYNWGDGGPTGSVPFVNAANVVTCISDELGFGEAGLFGANTVEYVADSGWKTIDIPLEPLLSNWLAMGGNADKSGQGGAAYDKFLRYVVENPDRWVRDWSGNAYVMEGQFNPNPDADLPVIPDAESVRGRLLISSLSFLRAA